MIFSLHLNEDRFPTLNQPLALNVRTTERFGYFVQFNLQTRVLHCFVVDSAMQLNGLRRVPFHLSCQFLAVRRGRLLERRPIRWLTLLRISSWRVYFISDRVSSSRFFIALIRFSSVSLSILVSPVTVTICLSS